MVREGLLAWVREDMGIFYWLRKDSFTLERLGQTDLANNY